MTEEKTDEKPAKAPRKRAPKPDAIVSQAQDLARRVLEEEFPGESIGEHVGVSVEDDRVMTHAFSSSKSGYRGWEWFATLSRAPRAKNVTVCEWGLRPAEDALLAPAWVPWADRVRPEDVRAAEEQEGRKPAEADPAGKDGGTPAREDAPDSAAGTPDEEHVEAQESAEAPEPSAGSHAVENPADAGAGSLEIEDDLTAEEIEASVSVKRRGRRRRRYSTRAKKQ